MHTPVPRSAAVPLAALLLCPGAAAHGILNKPLSRNGLSCLGLRTCPEPPNAGLANGGNDPANVADWFSWNVTFAGPPTLTAKERHGVLTQCLAGGVPPDYKDCDWTLGISMYGPPVAAPWRAPGRSRVFSPCGHHGPNKYPGVVDGAELPPVPAGRRGVWVAGSTAEVAFGIAANHGGGYSYRLCPAADKLTEECFQRTPLNFSGATQDLVGLDGKVWRTIPAVRTAEGTFPEGSEWTRNPIPSDPKFFAPAAPGMYGYPGPKNVSIMDRVEVPASLAPGDYVLGWRWDCEQTPQVWSNCADISVVAPTQ